MIEKDQLIMQLGAAATQRVTDRFARFAIMPRQMIESLASEALAENWGNNQFVLFKYLAVHVRWSIEQERFTASDNQFYVSAGSLQTRYGTPLYLAFGGNRYAGQPNQPPWVLVAAGSRISAPRLPIPPEIPEGIKPTKGTEIVLMHDHILGENTDRVEFLAETPPVAQMCAVAGAIQWSLNRDLQIPYWYFGRMNYLVPLYLTSRENVTMAPDLVAPVEVSENMLLVRTVLPPHMPYANARVAARRHDRLPPWMLDCWNREAAQITPQQVENPENTQELAE